ncbi:MAG: hypothetical protein ABW128_10550 [Rhizorhabdus sp.]
MENDQNISAIAHWVVQHRGQDGQRYIAEQIGRLAGRGEQDCARMWEKVAMHFDRLTRSPVIA